MEIANLQVSVDSRKAVSGLSRLDRSLKKSGDQAEKTEKKVNKFNSSLSGVSAAIKPLAKGLGSLFGGIALFKIMKSTLSLLSEFEKGLIGVGKTADLSGFELDQLGQEITDLSKRLPETTRELLAITQAAGQLGVKGRSNLVKFTETVAKLGTASNLSGDEAATTLARMLIVTNESIDDVDRLASVIVSLGNNFAANEREIASHATRIAQAGAAYNLSSREASALGAAFASMGIEAELSGSTVGRALLEIRSAIEGNQRAMSVFSKLIGISEKEIKNTFNKNSVDGFVLFLQALKNVNDAGSNTTDFLRLFNLEGVRLLQTLPTAAKRIDVVKDALHNANKEFLSNQALLEENKRQLETLDSRWNIFKNTLKATTLSIVDNLEPALKRILTISTALADQGLFAFVPEFKEAFDNEIKSQGQVSSQYLLNKNLRDRSNPLNIFKEFFIEKQDEHIKRYKVFVDGLLSDSQNLTVAGEDYRKSLRLTIDTMEEQIFAFGKTSDEIERYRFQQELMNSGFIEGSEAFEFYSQKFNQLQSNIEQAERISHVFDTIRESAGRAFEDIIIDSGNARDALNQLLKDIAKLAIKKSITDPVSTFIAGSVTGLLSGLNPFASGLDAPAQAVTPPSGIIPNAHGGNNSAFQPLLVGERGPELIVPRTDNTVIPNNTLSPNIKIVINNNTGSEATATASAPQYDGDSYIVGVVLEAVSNNVDRSREILKRELI